MISIGMMRSVDREWGEEMYMIIIEPDPQLERLRRLDAWLSRLTVWQRYLLVMPFALMHAGITVWLNSLLPAVDPTVIRF
jgi:hypothetical protein